MFEPLIPILKTFEGDIPHMYLDTRGYVTAAVGHLLLTVMDAYKLPFLLPNGQPADQQDIFNDFQAIKRSEAGKLPGYYARIADLRLSQPARDALLLEDIQAAYAGMKHHVEIDAFPGAAQNAVLNMAFQLGVEKLVGTYPHFMAACERHDWKQCAAECHINGAPDARNAANKNFFLSLVAD